MNTETLSSQPSAATRAPARQLLTTAAAAQVILGGTDVEGFWGFDFDHFVKRYQAGLLQHIGNPAEAPWRKLLDFTSQDYIELESLRTGMDFSPNPAEHIDRPMAIAFARRCDILGVNGPIGAGKDTVAEALEPYGYTRMSFSDALRLAGTMTYGVPLRYFLDRDLKESPLPGANVSPRRLIQLLGTEVVRSICEDAWVNRLLLRATSALQVLPAIAKHAPHRISGASGIKVVNADTRFENEARFLRSMGGRVVRVSRPSLGAAAQKAGGGHASEAGISSHPSDILVVNDGTKAAFQLKVVQLLVDPASPAALARRQPRP